MRQRTIWVAALVLVAGVGAAVAEDDHPTWYAGVGAGRYEIEYVDVILPSLPPQIGGTSKESADLTKVMIGFRPSRYFAIEGAAVGGGDFAADAGSFTVSSDHRGLDISALGIVPLADRRVEIFGRLGVSHNSYNVTVADKVDPLFSGNYRERVRQSFRLYGVGAQVNFGSRKNYAIGVEYNKGDTSDRLDSYSEALLRLTIGWGGGN